MSFSRRRHTFKFRNPVKSRLQKNLCETSVNTLVKIQPGIADFTSPAGRRARKLATARERVYTEYGGKKNGTIYHRTQ